MRGGGQNAAFLKNPAPTVISWSIKVRIAPVDPNNVASAIARAREKGIDVTKQMIDAFPNLVGIIAVDSVSLPAAAEAVKQKGKAGKIVVTGFSTPNDMRQYVKDGTANTFILWSPVDLGELTVRLAHHLVKGGKVADGMTVTGWKEPLKVQPTRDNPEVVEVIMSPPTDFTKENVDKYNF